MSKTNGFVDDLFAGRRGSNHNRILSGIKSFHRDDLRLARLVKTKLFQSRFKMSFNIHRDNPPPYKDYQYVVRV